MVKVNRVALTTQQGNYNTSINGMIPYNVKFPLNKHSLTFTNIHDMTKLPDFLFHCLHNNLARKEEV